MSPIVIQSQEDGLAAVVEVVLPTTCIMQRAFH